jgi:hypothetical protein
MPEIRQILSLTTGAPYQVSVNISYIEGNRNLVMYAAGEFTKVFSSIGTHTFIFTAVSSSPLLRVYLGPGISGQITFDDIAITACGGAWADAMES